MKLHFTVSESDVLAFSENFYRSSATHQKARQSSRFFLPILLTPLMFLFIYRFGFSPIPIAIFLAGMISWFIFYPKRYDSRVRKHAKKQLRESSYSNMFGAYALTFDEDSLRSTGPTGESSYNWNSIHQVELTDDYLFVFLSGPMGFPIQVAQIGLETAQQANRELNRFRKSAS